VNDPAASDWVARLHEAPDALHRELTPAVHALVAMGLPALPAVLPLLRSDDALTRERAQAVLSRSTRAWVGAQHAGQRQVGNAFAREWTQLWRDNGDYDWRAAGPLRDAAVQAWAAWLAAHGH
jgi:hypothetical protein